MILLGLIIYIFGILLTDAVLDAVIEAEALEQLLPQNDSGENVAAYFGTLYASTLTLFRTISNGVTWRYADDLLVGMNSLGEFWALIYRFYIAFCSFCAVREHLFESMFLLGVPAWREREFTMSGRVEDQLRFCRLECTSASNVGRIC